MSMLWVDEELDSTVFLDSTVTVVDACNLRDQLRETRENDLPSEAVLQVGQDIKAAIYPRTSRTSCR
jgi:G3E family GTPase